MTPNQITAGRVGAAFVAVALFTFFDSNLGAELGALALTVTAIALDGVDGYVARRRNLATPLGAQFDILSDRIVENLFFTFFATAGAISVWVPVFFFVRGTVTDFLRSLAARAGRSGFGRNSMLETKWGRALVGSRASRAAYAALKCICFCYLGGQLSLSHVPALGLSPSVTSRLTAGAQILVGATVAFCFIRALPVLWEGRRYLLDLAPATARTPVGAIR